MVKREESETRQYRGAIVEQVLGLFLDQEPCAGKAGGSSISKSSSSWR